MNKDTISEENSGRVSFLRGLSTNTKEENSDMNAASERSLNQITRILPNKGTGRYYRAYCDIVVNGEVADNE